MSKKIHFWHQMVKNSEICPKSSKDTNLGITFFLVELLTKTSQIYFFGVLCGKRSLFRAPNNGLIPLNEKMRE